MMEEVDANLTRTRLDFMTGIESNQSINTPFVTLLRQTCIMNGRHMKSIHSICAKFDQHQQQQQQVLATPNAHVSSMTAPPVCYATDEEAEWLTRTTQDIANSILIDDQHETKIEPHSIEQVQEEEPQPLPYMNTEHIQTVVPAYSSVLEILLNVYDHDPILQSSKILASSSSSSSLPLPNGKDEV